jgi:hypothetical protein
MATLHKLDECLNQITKIFKTTANKYESHLKCYPILHQMAADDDVIFEVFRRTMEKPKFFEKKHCTPDFQVTLLDAPECFLFVNFFGPNQDKRTDISYSTMHHHDDYLLSTLNAKGAGYKSMIFKQGYEINRDTNEAKIDLEKYVRHTLGHIEFINCHTAHTIFYPESMTMTYGLWSTFYPTPQASKIKSSPFIQKNKELIKKAINIFRVNTKSIGVAQYREDYFCPENGKITFLDGQVLPPNGDHFVQNFFNIAHEFLQFSDKRFLKKVYSDKVKEIKKGEELPWLERVIENDLVERNYDSYNMYLPKRNVPIEEYKKCYNF